jgi:hypothetical protein
MFGVLSQGDEVVERGHPAEPAGEDQAHKHIADVRAVEGVVEQIKGQSFFYCFCVDEGEC